jgi:hypothetical protein
MVKDRSVAVPPVATASKCRAADGGTQFKLGLDFQRVAGEAFNLHWGRTFATFFCSAC